MLWTVVLDKTLESPLDCKEIQLVHPKGNQFWIFIGKTDAEAEGPILWLPGVKNWLIEKDPDAGKDWKQEKETAEDEMVRWHHQLKGHEFEQIPRDREGQGSLVCCYPQVSSRTQLSDWTAVLINFCLLLPSQAFLVLLTVLLWRYSGNKPTWVSFLLTFCLVFRFSYRLQIQMDNF